MFCVMCKVRFMVQPPLYNKSIKKKARCISGRVNGGAAVMWNVVVMSFLCLFVCERLAPGSLGSRLFRFCAATAMLIPLRLLILLLQGAVAVLRGILALKEKGGK